MYFTAIVETSFSGSHTVPSHPVCGERHGHTWRVRVEIASDEKDMDGGAMADIVAAIRQYHHRDLDRFLPGVDTHASGLAAYFREILSDYPITAIEVITDDGYGVRVEWRAR